MLTDVQSEYLARSKWAYSRLGIRQARQFFESSDDLTKNTALVYALATLDFEDQGIEYLVHGLRHPRPHKEVQKIVNLIRGYEKQFAHFTNDKSKTASRALFRCLEECHQSLVHDFGYLLVLSGSTLSDDANKGDLDLTLVGNRCTEDEAIQLAQLFESVASIPVEIDHLPYIPARKRLLDPVLNTIVDYNDFSIYGSDLSSFLTGRAVFDPTANSYRHFATRIDKILRRSEVASAITYAYLRCILYRRQTGHD